MGKVQRQPAPKPTGKVAPFLEKDMRQRGLIDAAGKPIQKKTPEQNNEETRRLQQRLAAMYGGLPGDELSSTGEGGGGKGAGVPMTDFGGMDVATTGKKALDTGSVVAVLGHKPTLATMYGRTVGDIGGLSLSSTGNIGGKGAGIPLNGDDSAKPVRAGSKPTALAAFKIAPREVKNNKKPPQPETFTFPRQEGTYKKQDLVTFAKGLEYFNQKGPISQYDNWFVDVGAPKKNPESFKASNGRVYAWGDPIALFDGADVPWGPGADK